MKSDFIAKVDLTCNSFFSVIEVISCCTKYCPQGEGKRGCSSLLRLLLR